MIKCTRPVGNMEPDFWLFLYGGMQSVVCWAYNSSRARPADGYNFHVRGDVVQVRTLFRHHAQSHSTTTAPYVSIIFQMFFKNIRSHLGSPPGGDRSTISTEILVPGARRNSCENSLYHVSKDGVDRHRQIDRQAERQNCSSAALGI